jgi:penicillin-binding protein 2
MAGDQDSRRFRRRLAVLALLLFAGLILIMARMVWLQVTRHEELAAKAEQNRIARQAPVSPSGGPR